ncbi:MAG: GNAT family N-acetyltransferase [Propionibacteriaceae bacterium]|jgi:ribosomal-protein-alanine N-acetyltransferase|nr:GNAT family N-acetyltransferase [Propionibacteriaceae bacterium]
MARVVDVPAFPSAHRWPVTLRYGSLGLTPFRPRDVDEVSRVRSRNAAWLSPWDATSPTRGEASLGPVRRVRSHWEQARAGLGLPWLVRWAGDAAQPVIGQCTVANVVYGSAQTASVGYWIDQRYAGRSLTPLAVAMAVDYCFRTVGLHRLEICIRPENRPSLRVAEKLGFRYEGRRPRYIHIAGDWRDHEIFACTKEEAGDGLVPRVAGLLG